jgi:hypothetical protein
VTAYFVGGTVSIPDTAHLCINMNLLILIIFKDFSVTYIF